VAQSMGSAKRVIRLIIGVLCATLGLFSAAYGALGSLFVAGAIGKPGEIVGTFDVAMLVLVALFGAGLCALGIKVAVDTAFAKGPTR
jgi:hypothetical protein